MRTRTSGPSSETITRRVGTDPSSIAEAADVLSRGGLVAFPTETVYGLGARADRSDAVRRIFEAKDRPATNPLIVHVADAGAARALAAAWPDAADRLAAAFWPGPLTLVVERDPARVADEACAGGPTVALRCPSHPVAHALLEACAVPVAAPSANRSTSVSPTSVAHVLKTLDGRIDVVIDGGSTPAGIESTIVDVSRSPAVLLRHGALALDRIASVVRVVDHGSGVTAPGEIARAPGRLARHYAPSCEVVVVPPPRVLEELAARRAGGKRARALVPAGVPAPLDAIVLDADPVAYARDLYAALHRLEDEGSDVIVVAEPPDEPAWAAVRDRLRRASA